MKKLRISLIVAALFFCTGMTALAQLRAGVNINIGEQPSWHPTGVKFAEYYYLPDIEVYYYVPKKQFIYLSNKTWTFSLSLPSQHNNYNLYTGRKIVINKPSAYLYFDEDKEKYRKAENR
jgi:hypothetical protein